MQMGFGFFDLLKVIGSLGLFIYGMKVMSEAIQKVAGNKMRQVLGAMTSNRFLGILSGLTITTLVQSSSATTVLVVSFVNAGLITLTESIGVIMGTNVGTTVTAWLVSLLELGRFSISLLSLPIIAIGFPMMFFSREKVRLWGEVLIGFALLFLGLAFMKEIVPDFSNNPEVLSFLRDSNYNNSTLFGKYLLSLGFVLVGIVITLIVQSSSAAMALTLVMCNEGWIPFPLAAAIVLGENIGTTVTANLAALVGNVHAKRAARSHLIFNVLGVGWALLVLPVFLNIIAYLSESISGANPFVEFKAMPIALALFHTIFNVANVLLLVGFIPTMARMAKWMVPSKKSEDEEFSLDYIGSGLMETPELSILEARKELIKFADLMRRAFKYIPLLVTEMDEKKLQQFTDQLRKYEEIGDRMEIEIADYLSKASKGELSSDASNTIRSMLNVANYLERIGDIYLEVSRNLNNRKRKKAYFTQEMRDNILKYATKVSLSLDVMVKNIEASDNNTHHIEAKALEDELNEYYHQLREDYIKKLEKGKYRLESGMYYSDLLAEMERIGDHAASISQSLSKQGNTTTQE